MKHAIITCSDKRFGDFLADHWYRSLSHNSDLTNFDVVVLDYGLSDQQRSRLDGTILVPCVKDGHVTSLRFRDMARFLEKRDYDQVMTVDGGDIIFQTDISHVFEIAKTDFRASVEPLNIGFDYVTTMKVFQDKRMIKKKVRGKRMINAGMILGPYDKMLGLCRFCDQSIKDKAHYGPDQIAVNYYLREVGFIDVGERYNFSTTFYHKRFRIVDGKFLDQDGSLIPIVHNTGAVDIVRTIKNFGYGPQYNEVKQLTQAVRSKICITLDKLTKK